MLSLVTEDRVVPHTSVKGFETFEHLSLEELSLEELKNLREKESNPTKRKKLQIEIINRIIQVKTPLIKLSTLTKLSTIVAEYVPPVVELTERERLLLDIQYGIIFENKERIPLAKTTFCPVVENEETYDGVFIEFIGDNNGYVHKYYGPLGSFTDFSREHRRNPDICTGIARKIIYTPSKFPDSELREVIRYYDKKVSSSLDLKYEEIRRYLINDETRKKVCVYKRCKKNNISQEEAFVKWEIFTNNHPKFK